VLKIYSISLLGSDLRRRAVLEQSRHLGLDVEFFDAVDGRGGLPAHYNTLVNRAGAQRRLGKVMADTELSCALSHALLCKKISEDSETAGAIILEDDAILGPDFANLVQSGELQNSAEDLVLLYHSRARVFKDFRRQLFNNFYLRRPIGAPSGAVAYYVSRKGAQVISDKSLPISGVADWGFDIALLDAKCIEPAIVHHPELQQEQSTIRATQEITKVSLFAKLKNRSYRRYMVRKPFSERIS
jgi:glycosyl transferase family 25